LHPMGFSNRAIIAAYRFAVEAGQITTPEKTGDFARDLRDQQLKYRAAYILSAARRMTPELRENPDGQAMKSAMARERRFFEQHRAAHRARARAATQVRAAFDEFGPTLGWYATLDDR